MLELTCCDEYGNPVHGYVELVQPNGDLEIVQTSKDGIARGCAVYRSATIKPLDGHWNVLVGPLENEEKVMVLCPTLERERALIWWRRLLCPNSYGIGKGSGIRVGVIDIPFKPDDGLMHVKCYDIEGNQLNFDKLPHVSHGLRVCKIISERSSTPHQQGIACDVELFFIDVSDDFSKTAWDFDKIGPAIELLTDEFNVDIINISGGSFASDEENWKEISEFLEEYISGANNHGVLIFAAVGNDAESGIALPAGMSTVMGVGAIGLCDIAPKNTLMAAYEQCAYDMRGAIGALPSGERVFHYLDTGSGIGLNLVGPGIGIVMEIDGGGLAEYEGTSYACPAVVAAAASRLGESLGDRPKQGRDRYIFSTKLIRSICVDLGMERGRQGWGLPIHK